MVAVHIVADAQWHEPVRRALELPQQQKVQPCVGVRVRAICEWRLPHDVAGEAVQVAGAAGNGLFMAAAEPCKVEPGDEFPRTLQVPDEPVEQMLGHDPVAEDALEGGVVVHAEQRSHLPRAGAMGEV